MFIVLEATSSGITEGSNTDTDDDFAAASDFCFDIDATFDVDCDGGPTLMIWILWPSSVDNDRDS